MNKTIDDLASMMNLYPGIHVIPVIDSDRASCICEASEGNIACSFGKACIAKCIRIGDTTFLYGEGSEWDVLSALYGWDWCETRSREEREEKYGSLPWEKCIAVSIDMPE